MNLGQCEVHILCYMGTKVGTYAILFPLYIIIAGLEGLLSLDVYDVILRFPLDSGNWDKGFFAHVTLLEQLGEYL